MKQIITILLICLSLNILAQNLSKYYYFTKQIPDIDSIIKYSKTTQTIIGDDYFDETIVVNNDTLFDGDIIIINNGKLIINPNTTVKINGDLLVLDSGYISAESGTVEISGHLYFLDQSICDFNNDSVTLPMDYRYQYGLYVMNSATVNLTNSYFDFKNGLLEGGVAHNATLNLICDTFAQSVTLSVLNSAELNVSHTHNAWEFLLNDSCKATFSNSQSLILWFYFPENCTASYTFPNGMWVEQMTFDSTITGLEQIPYSVSIDSCYNINWGMFPMLGSHVTIKNSDMRTCGFIFNNGIENTVSGLFNEQFYTNDLIDISDRNLYLENSRVRTWNLYTMDTTTLNIQSSLFGEALSMENSTINIIGAICDGSGGYLGTNNANMNCVMTQIECQLVLEGKSTGIFLESEIYFPWSQHVFAEHAISVIGNTTHNQDFSVRDTSFLIEIYIDTLNHQFNNDIVPINGTLKEHKGALCPYFINEFQAYYTYLDSPSDTVLIQDSLPYPKHNQTLCYWNTQGLLSGNYKLFIHAVINNDYTDPVIISKEVKLYQNTYIDKQLLPKCIIHPNPTSNIIYVNTTIEQPELIEILNISGNVLKTQKIYNNEIKINLSDYPAGVYFIRIKNKYNKFVIQKVLKI